MKKIFPPGEEDAKLPFFRFANETWSEGGANEGYDLSKIELNTDGTIAYILVKYKGVLVVDISNIEGMTLAASNTGKLKDNQNMFIDKTPVCPVAD